ncbi:MAG: excinuclease ABC subunit UvrC [Coriobacteriia bacterium]|nr:excinuclease ABC subunit UvrC [Coriobacteriia bacterium]
MPAPDIRQQLARVPESPGVYLWKDATGRILYVGKAKSLRSRMRQYTGGHDGRAMVPLMMARVTTFDYYVTKSEVDSLVLEANLIKETRPPYNVDYRDDKTFPFIALTTSDPFPAIKYTREKHRPGTRYFGPYTDAKAARATVEIVRRVYPICRADCVEWKRVTARGGEPTGKPCFDHHVGKGPGPCVGAITREEYAVTVGKVAAFLDGRRSRIVSELESSMRDAAAELDYERAARFRNRLDAVRSVLERQTIVSESGLDADVVGVFREETIAAAHVFQVREGRVLTGAEFVLDQGLDISDAELVEGFLLRYYGQTSRVPKQVLVAQLPQDPDAFEGWLTGLRGSKVRLAVPSRGEKRSLLELANTNARHALARYSFRTRYDESRTNAALLELESALALPAPPLRIEAFDISTLHGRFSVGSMVVFDGGRPEPSAYRHFRVRLDAGESNDVAMMREVLSRRFIREMKDGARFAKRPDLLVVDGGRAQLSAAVGVLAELGLAGIPVVALAKREEELFVPGWDDPVVLPAGSPSLYLAKRVRDEAHRFAIAYHRDLRSRAMTASILDEVPGVGPTRKKALIKAFGSVRKLRTASVEEVAAVKGVGREVASDVVEYLGSRAASGLDETAPERT